LITIVEEKPEYAGAIARLNRAAFDGAFEAELVIRLHRDGLVVASLVALDDADLVGHILFSDLTVEVDGRPVKAVALAPMAVQAEQQRQGVGGRLIQEGCALVRQRGRGAVIVLGHPAYYPRFGFSAALAAKLRSPFTGEAFMALELEPGALAGRAGSVHYPPAFGIV